MLYWIIAILVLGILWSIFVLHLKDGKKWALLTHETLKVVFILYIILCALYGAVLLIHEIYHENIYLFVALLLALVYLGWDIIENKSLK